MKTITVQDSTWQRLIKTKAELMHSTMDQTIKYLFHEEEKGVSYNVQ